MSPTNPLGLVGRPRGAGKRTSSLARGPKLSEAQKRALAVLREHGPCWTGETTDGNAKRVAGTTARALERHGLVTLTKVGMGIKASLTEERTV